MKNQNSYNLKLKKKGKKKSNYNIGKSFKFLLSKNIRKP